MSGSVFLDTNILVYLFSVDESDKRNAAIKVVNQSSCVTGINNINELTNVLLKKFKTPYSDIIRAIDQITNAVKVVGMSINTIKSAVQIADKYRYSYYDSLVIAYALENQCDLLYSEDMHHQQVINETLTIINIFR